MIWISYMSTRFRLFKFREELKNIYSPVFNFLGSFFPEKRKINDPEK